MESTYENPQAGGCMRVTPRLPLTLLKAMYMVHEVVYMNVSSTWQGRASNIFLPHLIGENKCADWMIK